MDEGLAAILDEIYAPCGRSSEQPCGACVQIGLEKAFRYGFKKGEAVTDEKIKALIAKKDCSLAAFKKAVQKP